MNAEASLGCATGGGSSYSGKASIAELSSSHSFNILNTKVTISAEVGIGVAVGGNIGIGNNSASLGMKTPLGSGIYGGINIDLRG